jgi:hypothetical protein
MGDGHSVRCDSVGTAYTASSGDRPSPTCGYVYPGASRSQPGHRYTVTAATTWTVTWVGGGQSGSMTVVRSSTTTLEIDELQVVAQ